MDVDKIYNQIKPVPTTSCVDMQLYDNIKNPQEHINVEKKYLGMIIVSDSLKNSNERLAKIDELDASALDNLLNNVL